MKRYKIVENRPELTKEQVEGGLDFNKVVKHAAVVKKSFFRKWMLSVAGVVIVATSGIIYYENNNSLSHAVPVMKKQAAVPSNQEERLQSKEAAVAAETSMTPVRENNVIEQVIVSGDKAMPKRKAVQPITVEPVAIETDMVKTESPDSGSATTPRMTSGTWREEQGPDKLHPDTDSMTAKNNPETKTASNYTCKLIKSGNPCFTDDSLTLPYSRNCDRCEFVFSGCKEMDKKESATGVWLTIKIKGVSSFEIKSGFKNITLMKSNGKSEHPYAIAYDKAENKERASRYLLSSFKAKKFTSFCRKRIDLILLFPDAEVGDKIVIDKLINAEIQK